MPHLDRGSLGRGRILPAQRYEAREKDRHSISVMLPIIMRVGDRESEWGRNGKLCMKDKS